MAVDISWLNQGLPIFAFALVFFVAYAILAKTKVLGDSKWINSVICLILAIIFITFSSVRTFLLNITPWFIVLLSSLFFLLLLIAFATKDWEKFTKPIAIVTLILLVIIIIIAIFYTFPSTQALLPGAIQEDSYCSSNEKVYDYDYYNRGNCYKSGDVWKCEDSRNDINRYDKCSFSGSEYKCYDYYDYIYEEEDCDDSSSNGDSNNDIFENLGDWFYREKITNAFWLLVVAIVAMIIVIKAK